MFPVSVGDSFYLCTRNKHILVDGGKNKNHLNPILKNHLITKIDYMICTHADEDHINGLIGVLSLKTNAVAVSEVWLPSIWATIVDELITEDAWGKIKSDVENIKSLEELADKIEDEILSSSESRCEIHNELTKEKLIRAESVLKMNRNTTFNHKRKIKILSKVVKTISLILELLIAATDKQCKIRWFEYSNSKLPTGGEPELTPVNCSEVFRFVSGQYSLVEAMSLSLANQRSLVFRSPNVLDENNSDVVFSADSDFKFSQPKPQLVYTGIVTTAHHGSHEHVDFYIWINNLNNQIHLVRSDCRRLIRPCQDFILQKQNNIVYCTICRLSYLRKQFTYKTAYEFVWQQSWKVTSNYGSKLCQCQ